MTTRQRRWLLSGGIGSGKSAIRILFEEFGLATIDADSIGHEVLEPNGPAFAQVVDRWPEVLIDGRIDRKALGSIAFASEPELKALEGITHSHIFGRINQRVQRIDGSVIVEIPLLSPSLGDGWRRIVVDSDEQTRVDRLIGRGMSIAEAHARMRSQPSRPEWLAKGDLVIPNHGSLDELTMAARRLSGQL